MEAYQAFRIGARKLSHSQREYTELHKAHGIHEADWQLLTQKEYWTAEQARSVRTILANVVEVAMTIAGMPPVPLPGQYVAAVIAEIVSPPNYLVAAMKTPDTFDAADASGLFGTHEVKPMSKEQMMALVMAFAGDMRSEPQAHQLPSEISEEMQLTNAKA